MGCCGPSHSSRSGTLPAAPVQPQAWVAPASARSVVLRYRERARVMVRGPVTGRSYEFSAGQPSQSVDARDAESLLRTRYFMRG